MARFCAECVQYESQHVPLRRVGRYLLCEGCACKRSKPRPAGDDIGAAIEQYMADAMPDFSPFCRRLQPGEVLPETRTRSFWTPGAVRGWFDITGLTARVRE